MADKKKDEELKDKEVTKPIKEEEPKVLQESPKVVIDEDVESLKAQLKQSNSLLEKALSVISNISSGKMNPDKEYENADKGVVDWSPKKERDEFLNERIPFRAFKDNDRYKEDIHVGINGYNYVIKRGVTVMIPRFVYLAIENSEKQLAEASDYSQGLIDHYDMKSKQYGIEV